MTYYGAKELAASFRTVRNNTVQVAEDIPEDKYSSSPAPGTRTVAQMFTHIAMVPHVWQQVHGQRMMTLEGFDFFAAFAPVQAEEQTPRTKAEIVALLRDEGEKFTTFLEGVSEEALADRVEQAAAVNQPPKSRLEMLLSAKEHEMHHRAQLMLIERQLGIVPHLTRQFDEFVARYQEQVKAKSALV